MNGGPAQVEASYRYCRRIARSSGSNFYLSFLLLGRPKRRAMDALYAFMRHTDDLGDIPSPLAARQEALGQWRAEVTAALTQTPKPVWVQDSPSLAAPLLPALLDTVCRFRIPPEHLLAVLDGVQMDLENRCYETFADLTEYCRRVASAVGLACLHVWGYHSDEALKPAEQCGLAFQLTNILRDLKEDSQQGRVYLPREELRLCDYAPADLAAGVADARFLRLMQLQLERAEQLYREAAGLFEYLPRDGQRALGMMITVYHRLLEEIRRDPAAVLSRRVSLGKAEKCRVAARWLLWPPKRLTLS